jgi:hypothetical protein
VTAFVRRLPRDGGEGALEEGVVYDVALVIFAFDNPVTGEGLALAGVCEDGGGVSALCGVYQKGPASPKGVQSSSPDGVDLPTVSMIPLHS